jgi:hypothetical protein
LSWPGLSNAGDNYSQGPTYLKKYDRRKSHAKSKTRPNKKSNKNRTGINFVRGDEILLQVHDV